jgi:hypothetical protein
MRRRHSDTPWAFSPEEKDCGIFKSKRCKMVFKRRERRERWGKG